MKSRLGAACGAILAALLLVLPARAEPTKLGIGYGNTADTLNMLIAKSQGIFLKHGIDATLLRVGNTAGMMAGITSGDLQIIMSNQGQMLIGLNGGLDLVVIDGGSRISAKDDTTGLVVRSDLAYSAPSSLAGLRIATPGYDSGLYITLRKWLDDKGVDASKIQFVESIPPQMGDLLKAHRVDAVTGVEPFLSRMVNEGYGKLAVRYVTEAIPDQPAIFWVSSREWAAKNPALVTAFRDSLKEGADYIAAHPDDARKVEKDTYGVINPGFPRFDATVTPADLQVYYDMGRKLGLYTRTIDLASVILK
ncbi:MAG TPA: ABC transporter substrate-binding protein [Stellaceae bacterium]|nr:ABC transporter substrate-binding protein [Stellaceae bacterium]